MSNLIYRHKIFFGVIVFLMVLVIPLTVIQVQQQQNLKQRASESFTITLSSRTDLKPGDEFDVDVTLKNPTGKDISGIDFILTGNNDTIEIKKFIPSSYQPYVNNILSTSSLQFTGINTSDTINITNSEIPLGKLTLKALNAGDSAMSFFGTVTYAGSTGDFSAGGVTNYSIVAQTSSAPTSPPTTIQTAVACGDIINGKSSSGTCTSGTCVSSGDPQSSDGLTYSCISTNTTPTALTTTNFIKCGPGNIVTVNNCDPANNQCGELTDPNTGKITYYCAPKSPVSTTTSTTVPFDCTSQSNNGQKNVCSDNSGICRTDYSIVGYNPETQKTSCNSSGNLSAKCCFYNPPVTPTPVPPTATPIAGAPTITNLKNRGDANSDGHITIVDFNIWRDEFKKIKTTLTSDFNNSGTITIVDFNIWKDGFKDPSLPH